MAELMESQAYNSLHTKFIQYEKSDSKAEDSMLEHKYTFYKGSVWC